jgi:DNA-binding GntR family transcriptional regulator
MKSAVGTDAIVVRNLSDQLVELVRNRILSGEVLPDRPIRQELLAAQLGVSKIPLREALTRLEQEGLLRAEANRGYFVRALSAEEAEEVFALRLKLEPETAARASHDATPNDRKAAWEALQTLDRATTEHGEGVGAFNRAFHLALIRPCRQPITIGILERLHILSERYVRKHLEPLGRDERANDEHRLLLEAWLAADDDKLGQLLCIHIGQTLEDLRRQLSGRGNERSPFPRA